ncbi:MAG: hypothetical protein WCQ53_03525 [bacterium]
MKRLVLIMIITFAASSLIECRPASSVKTKTVAGKKNKKKQQFIDLEGLDIQGMIDRPQTLYILKKSELNFNENYDEYDYMGAIIDATYKEPF